MRKVVTDMLVSIRLPVLLWTVMAGFLLCILHITFWLEGECFSLSQFEPRSILRGAFVWCSPFAVHRWSPRRSAFSAVAGAALGPKRPKCWGGGIHSVLSATFVTLLGFISDIIRQAFLLSEGKKLKYKMIRENILESKTMALKILQRFAGKAVSFSPSASR